MWHKTFTKIYLRLPNYIKKTHLHPPLSLFRIINLTRSQRHTDEFKLSDNQSKFLQRLKMKLTHTYTHTHILTFIHCIYNPFKVFLHENLIHIQIHECSIKNSQPLCPSPHPPPNRKLNCISMLNLYYRA